MVVSTLLSPSSSIKMIETLLWYAFPKRVAFSICFGSSGCCFIFSVFLNDSEEITSFSINSGFIITCMLVVLGENTEKIS